MTSVKSVKDIKPNMVSVINIDDVSRHPFYYIGIITIVDKEFKRLCFRYFDDMNHRYTLTYERFSYHQAHKKIVIYETAVTSKRINTYFNLFNPFHGGYYDIS